MLSESSHLVPSFVTSEEKVALERAGGAQTRAHDARHRHHTYFTVYDDLGYAEAAPRYSYRIPPTRRGGFSSLPST